MKLNKKVLIPVFAVVLLALIGLGVSLRLMFSDSANEENEALRDIDPTDMSQYYSMGEYYPPDGVDTLNIDWRGGRVEVVAYNGSDYFVEEAATRYLMENERLSYTLDGSTFTVHFSENEENAVVDAYKKVEIRIPRSTAQKLKALNINTDGEVVLRNIIAESMTVKGKNGNIVCRNSYSDNTYIEAVGGNVNMFVDNTQGYSIDFTSKSGVLDSYVDNGMKSYVSGDGHYPFKIKTKTGNLNISLEEPE